MILGGGVKINVSCYMIKRDFFDLDPLLKNGSRAPVRNPLVFLYRHYLSGRDLRYRFHAPERLSHPLDRPKLLHFRPLYACCTTRGVVGKSGSWDKIRAAPSGSWDNFVHFEALNHISGQTLYQVKTLW